MSEKGIMTLRQRHEQVQGYLGKMVTIEIDRPIGYVHHKGEKTLMYPINYGFIPGVLGGDGEELDVFLIGVDKPVSSFTGKIIGIVYRADDVEDKLVVAPDELQLTEQKIIDATAFKEQYFDISIRMTE